MEEYFNKITRVDPVNRAHLERYVRHLELKQRASRTIETKLWRIYRFLDLNDFKDAKTATQEDVENYFIKRRKSCTSVTVDGEILEIKLFMRWLRGKEDEAQLFQNIQMKRRHPKLPTEQLLSRNDIQKLVDACDRSRDRALVMLMWDSAARIGEIISLNIGHVEFDRYGAVVIVNGKTGRRRIRLISSVPDLQTWMNQHPLKTDANAPLFTTFHRYGAGTKRLQMPTIQNLLKRLARRAGIAKPVHPHAIRHARLTDLVRNDGGKRGLSEMELRLFAGWEKNSNMPEVYVHLSGGDIERKMLENAGLITIDDQAPSTLEPRHCPRCQALNPFDAMYCAKCSMALDERAAMKVDESTEVAKQSSEYLQLLAQIRKDMGGLRLTPQISKTDPGSTIPETLPDCSVTLPFSGSSPPSFGERSLPLKQFFVLSSAVVSG